MRRMRNVTRQQAIAIAHRISVERICMPKTGKGYEGSVWGVCGVQVCVLCRCAQVCVCVCV